MKVRRKLEEMNAEFEPLVKLTREVLGDLVDATKVDVMRSR